VRREPARGRYDRAAIDAILDAALVAHVGYVYDGHPVVVPTLHARAGDELLIHGSAAGRTMRSLGEGTPVCVTVTLIDGLVLARSVFQHSVNYRSVVLYGQARAIERADEKLAALRALTEQLVPGRWDSVRAPDRRELRATSILALPIAEASAKVREGPPADAEGPDGELDVWAGELPLPVTVGAPRPDPALRPGITVPDHVSGYRRAGLATPGRGNRTAR
jgi:nitroimidazol reductase NimA-like FMN-containing flavoprotein (pyridoxamine 5'-phosphate oxidase superfamily)